MSLAAVAACAAQPIQAAATPPTLEAPTFRKLFTSSSVIDTLLADGITGLPGAGTLIVMAATRSTTANRTHGTPTLSGISLSGSFSLVGTVNTLQPSTTNNVRVSMWVGRLTGTPGDGDVQMVTSGNVSQSLLAVYSTVGAALPHATQGTGTATTGTALTVAFDDTGTPAAASLSIGIYAQNGVGGAGLAATGFTSLADMATDFSTNMRVAGLYDLTSPANNFPVTGGQDGNAKSGVAVLLEQQI
jgi:hypothetical protein